MKLNKFNCQLPIVTMCNVHFHSNQVNVSFCDQICLLNIALCISDCLSHKNRNPLPDRHIARNWFHEGRHVTGKEMTSHYTWYGAAHVRHNHT